MKLIKYLLALLKGRDYVYTNFNIVEARRIGVQVGNNCRFIDTHRSTFSTEPYLIKIGNHVSMTNPQFVTHDGGVWVFRNEYPNIDLFGKIEIGNNCFIGIGVCLLPNTKIGNNCIVAAGAIVKGSFEKNSIIAGIPAKCIGTIDEYFDKNKDKFSYLKNLTTGAKKEEVLKHLKQLG